MFTVFDAALWPLPPPVLYVRGALMASDQLAIAVVGSRRQKARVGCCSKGRTAIKAVPTGFYEKCRDPPQAGPYKYKKGRGL